MELVGLWVFNLQSELEVENTTGGVSVCIYI